MSSGMTARFSNNLLFSVSTASAPHLCSGLIMAAKDIGFC